LESQKGVAGVQSYDAIIIGAGHNGLVTAAYLAKAGKRVLVLERRPALGGIAVTEEIFPGFKYSTCAHLAGSVQKTLVADLELTQHGLQFIALDPPLVALSPQGQSLLIPRDPFGSGGPIRGCSAADAASLEAFSHRAAKLASFLRSLYDFPLPSGAASESLPLNEMVKIAWKFHRLGKKEMVEFLRVLPMSIADWLHEWFEGELLKAALARPGILGTFIGPRAQGTSFVFLHRQLGQSNGLFQTDGWVRGGIGNFPQALARAAIRYGAEIRTSVEVVGISIKNGTATGVALSNGDEFSASAIISSADIKRTLLRLVEPSHLSPHYVWQINNIRSRGTLAKINLALDALPDFSRAVGKDVAPRLGGVIHVGPTLDYLERAADDAKYRRISKQPLLEIAVPSVADPSLAPPGKHVMSIWMQSAPYHLKEGTWREHREALGDAVVKLIEDYAPGFTNSILHRQVLTPMDLEETFGLTEGHTHHVELALDQIFFMRPVPGWARHRTPIDHLYLCGSGTHPGGDISGLPGFYAAKEILKR
jgi:phytoene dehydrogenase-like protein